MRRKKSTTWQEPLSGWIKPTEGRRHSLRLVLGCALLLLLPVVASADEREKNVLIFRSDDTSLPANVLINRAFRSTLKESWKSSLQIYDEGQDSFRIPNEKYEAEMVALLKRKYEGVHLDLIFAVGSPVLRFLLKHQGELFTDTPIIYLAADVSRIAGLDLGTRVTGVSGKVELAPTLDLALGLHPETQQVLVTSGNAPLDRGLLAQAQKEFHAYEGRADFTYLTDVTQEELRQRFSVLPKNTIVIFLSFNSDREGIAHITPEVLAKLAQLALPHLCTLGNFPRHWSSGRATA